MTRNADPLRFAYWVPSTSREVVIRDYDRGTIWDIDDNITLARAAEAAGFDYALTQIRFAAGHGVENQHESVAFSHALLAATEKLRVIAAILPGPWKPALAAKQIATINHLTRGRIALNVVSGWYRGEFDAIGEPWPDLAERHERAEEFVRALRGIWTEDAFSFAGKHYRFDAYRMQPKPLDPQPEIFQGGTSSAARDLAARVADWYFTNGNSPQGLAAQTADLREKATGHDRRVRTGVNAFVIARDTEEQARAVLDSIAATADPEALDDLPGADGRITRTPEENWSDSTLRDLVRYKDGFRSNLIGTPDQIADRILALKDAGADMLLLSFLNPLPELEYFGRHVLPVIRRKEATRASRATAA